MGWVAPIAGLASAIIGKKSADKAASTSQQGYHYLLNNDVVQGAQEQAPAATNALNAALGLGTEDGLQGSMVWDRLLGGPNLSNGAFDEFRNSTGYDWRMKQGQDAITGSAAARGLLNSGATAKGLTAFGQGLASDEYARFIQQQMGLQDQESNAFLNYLSALQGQQQTGLNAAYNTASQGASAGQQAAAYQMQGAQNIMSGIGMAAGGLTDWWSNRKAAGTL